jgi:hypothetical protein
LGIMLYPSPHGAPGTGRAACGRRRLPPASADGAAPGAGSTQRRPEAGRRWFHPGIVHATAAWIRSGAIDVECAAGTAGGGTGADHPAAGPQRRAGGWGEDEFSPGARGGASGRSGGDAGIAGRRLAGAPSDQRGRTAGGSGSDCGSGTGRLADRRPRQRRGPASLAGSAAETEDRRHQAAGEQ